MKTHRVGTLTLGVSLVIIGVLFLLHIVFPGISYTLIFRLWPVILIALGAEVLFANFRTNKISFHFDFGSVILLMILIFFAMGMAFIDYGFQHYLYICI